MRCLVFSDVHGNLEALDAVLEDAGRVDRYWCLGDLVGYGPDPNACIEKIRELPTLLCVAGNHDWLALGKVDLREFGPDLRRASLWTQGQLTPENRDYLAGLPERLVEDQFTLVHGSPRDPIWEYVVSLPVADASLRHFTTLYCLVGHTHLPARFAQRREGCQRLETTPGRSFTLCPAREIVNPGSVGQPRDKDTRASYALLDTETLTVEYRRVDYCFDTTTKKMQQAGILAYWPTQREPGLGDWGINQKNPPIP
jgi:diadenosine tetraphosphatase ApaH/serine/threonine PP2A family protein phosphatase